MSEPAPKRNIAIIGASRNRAKYGNRAVRAYRAEGWTVFPVNLKEETIEGVPAYRSILDIPQAVHRVSIYLPPECVLPVLDEVARKGVHELYLNPGSESSAVIARAQELGLTPILACSIVEIGRSPTRPD